jgi:hypothetical protein
VTQEGSSTGRWLSRSKGVGQESKKYVKPLKGKRIKLAV